MNAPQSYIKIFTLVNFLTKLSSINDRYFKDELIKATCYSILVN